jgi:hypothetical protein
VGLWAKPGSFGENYNHNSSCNGPTTAQLVDEILILVGPAVVPKVPSKPCVQSLKTITLAMTPMIESWLVSTFFVADFYARGCHPHGRLLGHLLYSSYSTWMLSNDQE